MVRWETAAAGKNASYLIGILIFGTCKLNGKQLGLPLFFPFLYYVKSNNGGEVRTPLEFVCIISVRFR